MNAAIRAVIRTAIYYNIEHRIRRGYAGLVKETSGKWIWGQWPQLSIEESTVYTALRRIYGARGGKTYYSLKEAGIEGLVVIGGDGSLRGH